MAAPLPAPGAGAADNAVYSANVVGYTKVNLSAGLNMVGVQFNKVGGGDQALKTSILLNSSYPGYDSSWEFDTAYWMKKWDPSINDYVTRYWTGSAGTDIDDDPAWDNQWAQEMFDDISSEVLSTASGAWINVPSDDVATIAGEVELGDTIVVQLAAGLNIVANPFPVEASVKYFGTLASSYPGYDSSWEFDTAYWMKKWDPSINDYITRYWTGSAGTDIDDDPTWDNQWAQEMFDDISAEMIPAGAAVWINVPSADTITFTRPFSVSE